MRWLFGVLGSLGVLVFALFLVRLRVDVVTLANTLSPAFGRVVLIALLVVDELSSLRSLTAALSTVSHITHVRDTETGSHLDRMSRYSRLIAKGLAERYQLDDDYIEHVFMFSPLHDIGKVALPDRILLKAGKLDREDRAVMNGHTVKGREMVLSVCCLRKRCFKLAGAALVYAGLLRIFPGLVVIGTLVPFVTHLVQKRRIHPDHRRMLLGGVLAAAVLVPTSLWVTGVQGYNQFYRHTIQVHDETPLTNHMGLRVIIAHKFFDFQAAWPPVRLATGRESGRMKYTRDNALNDPFEIWKYMRNERYDKYKSVGYGLSAVTLAVFVLIAYRIRSLWVAQCLAQIFIILLSQLTCYYYSFMILGAPLARLRHQLELGLFGLAAITQIIWINTYWNDDRYTALTIVSLVLCYVMLGMFWRRGTLAALLRCWC